MRDAPMATRRTIPRNEWEFVGSPAPMPAAAPEYRAIRLKGGFEPGKIYNLDSSTFIAKGDGVSGAHSDIDGPQVAHAMWQAALAS